MCKSQVSSIRSRDYLAKWAMEAKRKVRSIGLEHSFASRRSEAGHHGDLTRKIHAGVLEL
ncbi:hypothetical protein PAHAL_8G191100 [Panicum hallii]|jgi:hypothetical protein|uniref:Uncharacterized protein n=1 Tax=Panicum hallii TaxID=206008 RepID=A0A2T8I9E4_9POAL|nr:hypothetical protein PAHAL_8G191100 [Panicum hallii]